MSVCLKQNLGFFKLFSETDSKKQRRALLKHITPSQLRALSEVCNHLLTKHCKLENGKRKKLRKRVNTLKRVSAVKGNYKAKKNIVSQHGKGLLKLIPAIVSALANIFD